MGVNVEFFHLSGKVQKGYIRMKICPEKIFLKFRRVKNSRGLMHSPPPSSIDATAFKDPK